MRRRLAFSLQRKGRKGDLQFGGQKTGDGGQTGAGCDGEAIAPARGRSPLRCDRCVLAPHGRWNFTDVDFVSTATTASASSASPRLCVGITCLKSDPRGAVVQPHHAGLSSRWGRCSCGCCPGCRSGPVRGQTAENRGQKGTGCGGFAGTSHAAEPDSNSTRISASSASLRLCVGITWPKPDLRGADAQPRPCGFRPALCAGL